MLRRFLLCLVARAAAQAAAWSQWDQQITGCVSPTGGTGSALTDVKQISHNSVSVTYSGYSVRPTMMWLTNQEGTTIAFKSNSGFNNGGTTTLTWPNEHLGGPDENGNAYVLGAPTDVQVHTCPPPDNFSPPVRAWRGLYNDALGEAYSGSAASSTQVAKYEPSISVNWALQTFSVTADEFAPVLNYAHDASGKLLRVDAPEAGRYSESDIPIPKLTASVTACAAITNAESSSESVNPICKTTSLLSDITSSLEQGNGNPQLRSSIDDVAPVTYSGSVEAPIATFQSEAIGDCATYARDASPTGTLLGYADGPSLSLEIGTSQNLSSTIYVFQCCGITNPTNRCPGNVKYASVTVNELRTTANRERAMAFSASGFGVLSTKPVVTCDRGLYVPGQWVIINATNCTCEADPTNEFASRRSVWQCEALPGMWTYWTGPQVGLLVCLVLVAIIAVVCTFVVTKRRQRPYAKGFRGPTMVQIPPPPPRSFVVEPQA